MALVAYKKTGLTGGTASDLDSIDGADLSGGEVGFVFYSDDVYFYELDESIGGAESSPNKIVPDTNPGNKRWILHGIILGGETDFQGNYALQLQNIPDLASKGAGYWFDGVDDKMLLGTSVNLDIGTGDWSILCLLKSDGSGLLYSNIFDCSGGNDRQLLGYDTGGDLQLLIVENSVSKIVKSLLTGYENDGLFHYIGATLDRDSVTGMKLFMGGKEMAYATQDDPTPLTGDISPTGIKYVGSNSAGTNYFVKGNLSRFLIFNLALTAAEVKALSSGAPVPFKYIGASQTEFFTTANDRTFAAGATNWENVDIGTTWDETTDLSIVASATGQYGKITFTNIGTALELGKRYRLTYDYAETTAGFEFKLSGATGQTLGDAVAGTGQTIEFIAVEPYATTDFLGIYAKTAAAAAGNFDNFSLVQIGCVLNYDQPGICHGQWIDLSGNEMHGTVSGAIPTNLPANHQEKYVDLTVTGNTSFTLPMGYQITSIIVKETAGAALTGGLDCGLTTDGVEIVSGMAVGANATVNCTLVAAGTIGGTHTTADDTIYLSDGDDDTNWNGAELEARIQMQRITVN